MPWKDQPIPLTQRLSFKQARNTVLMAFFLGLILSVLQVVWDYQQQSQGIDDDVQAIMEISRTPAARIAYNIDTELANELTQGLLQSPSVMRAEIIDYNGVPLASLRRTPLPAAARGLSDLLFEATRIYSQDLRVNHDPDEELGLLRVEVDTYHYGKEFLSRAWTTLLTGFVRTLLLSISLLVMFYFMLTKPLASLIRAISAINPEQPSRTTLPCPPRHEQDEIGQLVATTNAHFTLVNHYIEQRQQAEGRLHKYLGELENIVSERTSSLRRINQELLQSNQQAEAARDQAEQMAEARAQFLASMSHEIRTPINGVLGMLELTLDESLSAAQRKRLTIAYDSGQMLIDLLNDILDLSKFETGHLQLEQTQFDLHHSLQTVVDLFTPNASRKGLKLQLTLDEHLPTLAIGDPTRISQILTNLVNNAIKFTEQGAIDVHASLQERAENRFTLLLAVEDSGIGIAPERLSHIFAPFVQADIDTTRRYGGTGLGLSLSKLLVDAMEGEITAYSTPGQGSRFCVQLPLERIDKLPQSTPSATIEKITAATTPTEPHIILIVEDNPANQLVAQGMLEQLGYRSVVADSGEQALTLCEQQTFALVLMDCNLPGISGYEAAGQLRQLPAYQTTPVIALTANALTSDRSQCLAAGMNDYLAKPYRKQDMLKLLNVWLKPIHDLKIEH